MSKPKTNASSQAQSGVSSQVNHPDSNRLIWETVWENSDFQHSVHLRLLELITQCISLPDSKVLEVGCGSATDSRMIAQMGGEVISLDFSWKALERVRAKYKGSKNTISLITGDTFSLPFPNDAFHLVFSQGLIEHFTDPLPAIREQIRVIRQSGFLLIDVPQRWSLARLNTIIAIHRGVWFAGWETAFSLSQLEHIMRQEGLVIKSSYGHGYFPAFVNAIRNFHTLDERHNLRTWASPGVKKLVETQWKYIEQKRWYYRWMSSIGVIAQKE